MTAATAARGAMPLAAHAREARTRSTRAAVALAIGIAAGFLLSEQILAILRAPIEQIAQSRDASLNYDSITGAFDLRVKIALFSGIVLSSPVWLFELFAYVSPGLTRRERRYTFSSAACAIVLFAAGSAFGVLLFPHMVEVLAGFASDQDSSILNAGYYVDFVLKLVVAFGVAFVLPVLLVLLNTLGALSARTIRRQWRIAVVTIAVFSAVVTPAADALSMFLVAAPMSMLYGAAVLVTSIADRRRTGRAITPSRPRREGALACSD